MNRNLLFNTYLKKLIQRPERARNWVKSDRLNALEKRIFQSYLMIRDNKILDSLKDLLKFPQTGVEYVNDQKHLLMGEIYLILGYGLESEKYLKLAIIGFKKRHDTFPLSIALFHYLNLLNLTGRNHEMPFLIKEMAQLELSDTSAHIRLLRAKFLYASAIGNKASAEMIIQELNNLQEIIPDWDRSPQLIAELKFYGKMGDFQKAQDLLEKLKKHRKYMISENYRFMKKLLLHVTKGSTIYAYKRDFSSIPLYFHQLKVIECLHLNDMKEAAKHWQELQKISPNIYENKFIFKGELCLFSLCLKKHQKVEVSDFHSPRTGTKSQRALQILERAKYPIKKASLYRLIYKKVPNSKNDLKKLALLICKTRKNSYVNIVSRKETYHLVADQSSSS